MIGTCALSWNDTKIGAVDRTICDRPVQVGNVLVAIGDGKLKFLDNVDVDSRQVLSILETAPRPLYLGFVRGS